MKREELTALGLEKEAIDKIMAINGTDIEKAKSVGAEAITEKEKLQKQLEEANSTIEKFGDYEETKKAAAEYKEKLEKAEQEHATKLADRDFQDAIKSAITKVGAKNEKAVKALLDIESLKGSKNQQADIEKAIQEVKKEADYLFASDEPIKNPIGGTGGGQKEPLNESLTDKIMAAAGIKPKE